jgi:hypothetical protein
VCAVQNSSGILCSILDANFKCVLLDEGSGMVKMSQQVKELWMFSVNKYSDDET